MSRLTAAMVEQYLDKIRGWFEDQVGLDREAIKKGKFSDEELEFLKSKGKVKHALREGLLRMMQSRQQKGLGTYDVDNHILLNPKAFDRLYSEVKADIRQGMSVREQPQLPRAEVWKLWSGTELKATVLRWPKGHKWAGRFIRWSKER